MLWWNLWSVTGQMQKKTDINLLNGDCTWKVTVTRITSKLIIIMYQYPWNTWCWNYALSLNLVRTWVKVLPNLVTDDDIKSGAKANAHHSWHISTWGKTNKILTVNVLGYLILTNTDFYQIISLSFLFEFYSWFRRYMAECLPLSQTPDSVSFV